MIDISRLVWYFYSRILVFISTERVPCDILNILAGTCRML